MWRAGLVMLRKPHTIALLLYTHIIMQKDLSQKWRQKRPPSGKLKKKMHWTNERCRYVFSLACPTRVKGPSNISTNKALKRYVEMTLCVLGWEYSSFIVVWFRITSVIRHSLHIFFRNKVRMFRSGHAGYNVNIKCSLRNASNNSVCCWMNRTRLGFDQTCTLMLTHIILIQIPNTFREHTSRFEILRWKLQMKKHVTFSMWPVCFSYWRCQGYRY